MKLITAILIFLSVSVLACRADWTTNSNPEAVIVWAYHDNVNAGITNNLANLRQYFTLRPGNKITWKAGSCTTAQLNTSAETSSARMAELKAGRKSQVENWSPELKALAYTQWELENLTRGILRAQVPELNTGNLPDLTWGQFKARVKANL